jgi:hypothetical protein
MPTAQLLVGVLSSSLIAGILGALIGGWFTLRGKRNDYANEYYKVVLARRVQAYEEVERLINMVKTAVLDQDGRLTTSFSARMMTSRVCTTCSSLSCPRPYG